MIIGKVLGSDKRCRNFAIQDTGAYTSSMIEIVHSGINQDKSCHIQRGVR